MAKFSSLRAAFVATVAGAPIGKTACEAAAEAVTMAASGDTAYSPCPQCGGLFRIRFQFFRQLLAIVGLGINGQPIYLDRILDYDFGILGQRLSCSEESNVRHIENEEQFASQFRPGWKAFCFGVLSQRGSFLFRKRRLRWPGHDFAGDLKARAMTRAVPRFFSAIPADDAAHVRAHCGLDGKLPFLVSISRDLGAVHYCDPAFAGGEAIE